MGADTPEAGFPRRKSSIAFDAASKESVGKVLDESSSYGGADRDIRMNSCMFRNAYPAAAIIETAKPRGCDLIVMASHGRRGLRKLLLGKVQTSQGS